MEECERIVEADWEKTTEIIGPLNKIQHLLSSCRSSLSRWSRESVLRREWAIKELSEKLRVLEEEEGPKNMGEMKRLKGELNVLLKRKI